MNNSLNHSTSLNECSIGKLAQARPARRGLLRRRNVLIGVVVLLAVAGWLLMPATHGSADALQRPGPLPMAGVGSAAAYAGPQGIFDAPNPVFTSVITILDTGEIYGMDLIGKKVAGFFHGAAAGDTSKAIEGQLAEYNAYDGGYIQSLAFDASPAGTGLKVRLDFPFGRFDAAANGQKAYGKDDLRALYQNPVALAELSGNYGGELSTVGTTMKLFSEVTQMSLSAAGSFSATANGCTFNGTLSRHGDKGVFDIAATAGGPACLIAGPMKGLMTPVSHGAAGTVLGFQMLSLDAKKSAMLFVTKG